jgi:hypothetical protein
MLDLLIQRLDEIEGAAPDPDTDEEVIDLMEQVASAPGGLQILIERYNLSHTPIIVRSLAFLLAVTAASPSATIENLILSFVEHLECRDDESTLINCLTAIQRHLILSYSETPSVHFFSVLYPFMMHCLEQSVFVQRGAIALLSRMYEDGLLPGLFTLYQTAMLQNTLMLLSALHDELLDRELEGLSDFLHHSQT